ncbi:hypothetical protein [Nocardia sp. NPDC005745]|uniref:hypothetical protein n=1 Tax=Nocardia sp. NPDC005745 TaxID=3157061 RepID=UPI0033CD911B
MIEQIRDYITGWNADAEPFRWTATADEILAQVAFTQANVRKLVDNNAKVNKTESRDTSSSR